jgi:hypothetical protein
MAFMPLSMEYNFYEQGMTFYVTFALPTTRVER